MVGWGVFTGGVFLGGGGGVGGGCGWVLGGSDRGRDARKTFYTLKNEKQRKKKRRANKESEVGTRQEKNITRRQERQKERSGEGRGTGRSFLSILRMLAVISRL